MIICLILLYFYNKMEGRALALVLWLQSATDTKIASITQVRNCHLLQRLLSKIEGFFFTASSPSNEWKQNYTRLRGLYEQVQTYMRDTLKISPPSTLSVMNLVQIVKGQSEDGLETLLHLVFIVCIRCPIKDSFIRCIMNLPNSAQMELMQIIQDWQTFEQEIKEENSEVSYYKQQLSRLEFLCQNLSAENASLRASLEEDYEKVKKNESYFAKLQKENEQLQRDLSQKAQQLRAVQQNYIDKYAQHNYDLIEQLKKTLLQRQQQYSQQIFNLKETVYSLQESLGEAKRQSSELQDQKQRRSIIQSRDQHQNCISIEKHKMKINQLLSLSKEATQKEISIKLENIQVKNQNAQLQSKLKKVMEENRKKQNQFLVSSDDASKLKIQFFTRIRDSLKQKFMDYKSKENRVGNNIDFEDD